FRGRPIRIWVCSAGYGLIGLDSTIAPYAATFSPGHPDSVVSQGCPRQRALPAWWTALARWKGPKPAGPRTIARVAEEHPADFLPVALSAHYMTAVAEDVQAAARALQDRNQLAIISVGAGALPLLADWRLPCEASLQEGTGGALASLNVRLAE